MSDQTGGASKQSIESEASALWLGGDMEALQLHISDKGYSLLFLLVYPRGALDDWDTARGRARWTVAFEEAFADSRLMISAIRSKEPGKRHASASVEGLSPASSGAPQAAWRAMRGPVAREARVWLFDKLDELAGARSLRLDNAQMMLPFCDLPALVGEMWERKGDANGATGGASVREALARARALAEAGELESSLPPGLPGARVKL